MTDSERCAICGRFLEKALSFEPEPATQIQRDLLDALLNAHHAEANGLRGAIKQGRTRIAELKAMLSLVSPLEPTQASFDQMKSRAEKAEAMLAEIRKAVLYADELYVKPTGWETSKGKWSSNMSIGFETRFEMLRDLASLDDSAKEGKP